MFRLRITYSDGSLSLVKGPKIKPGFCPTQRAFSMVWFSPVQHLGGICFVNMYNVGFSDVHRQIFSVDVDFGFFNTACASSSSSPHLFRLSTPSFTSSSYFSHLLWSCSSYSRYVAVILPNEVTISRFKELHSNCLFLIIKLFMLT